MFAMRNFQFPKRQGGVDRAEGDGRRGGHCGAASQHAVASLHCALMNIAVPLDLPCAVALPRFQPGGYALKRALICGIRRLLARREAINKINVFPVADGDTGSNLAFTLSAVGDALGSMRTACVDTLLRRAASEAIDGARGNSGAILAQFLLGISDALKNISRIDARSLTNAISCGSMQARLAVAQPIDGTILSVIGRFAECLRQQRDAGIDDLREIYGHALQSAREALAATPQQLAVLRKAGVVDAGAQGFVELLEGIQQYIQRGRAALTDHAQETSYAGADGVLSDSMEFDASSHRYCSECVLSADDLDRDAVRAALDRLAGSSLVIAGTREKLRIHMHLDQPETLFATLAQFGRVSAHKADDMRAQNRSLQVSNTVAIVVDSAADIPASALEHLPLHIVPVRLNFGAHDYLDKISLSSSAFYRELRENPIAPRTSQPPPGDFRRLFEFLLAHHAEVIYVGLSRALSGTLQAGEAVAARLDAQRIHVIDTRNASCGQGLLAMQAAQRAMQGWPAAQIVAELCTNLLQIQTHACIRDISYAVRGGRIPPWTLPLTRWLKLVPLAKMGAHGRLKVRGILRGTDRLPERFAQDLVKRLPAGQRWQVLVGHCDCREAGERLCAEIKRRLPELHCCDLVEAGSAIGAHAGPGSMVVSFMPTPVE